MYGLYRAWFGGGATGTGYHPCLQDTFSPPDTVVRVGNEGEHQFVAHKGVLAAHSGYLKALLASAPTTTTTASSYDPGCATTVTVTTANGQSQRPVTSVSVSSIGGEAFAPLLNYMYTGRLEVTLDNVYSVLLATHLLHMPGALEQCRAALLRLRAPPPIPPPSAPPVPSTSGSTTSDSPAAVPGNILRPIPSRLVVGPPLCWPPPTTLAYPPVISHLPPMQPLMQPTTVPLTGIDILSREKQERCTHYSAGEVVTKSPRSSPIPQHRHHMRLHHRLGPSPRDSCTPEMVSTVSSLPFVAAAAAAFTAFAVTTGGGKTHSTTRTSSPSRSVSPAVSCESRGGHSPHRNNPERSADREIPRERESEASSVRSCSNDQQRAAVSRSCHPAGAVHADEAGPPSSRSRSSVSNVSVSNVVAMSEHAERARSSRRRARASLIANEATSSTSAAVLSAVVYDVACCDGPVRFHRVLNENYSSTSTTTTTTTATTTTAMATMTATAMATMTATMTATMHGLGAQTRPQRNCSLTADGEDLSSENEENGGARASRESNSFRGRSPRSDSSNDGSSSNNGNNGACYTCDYCKHTFKSQYCYRKHAKRHLLPTRINEPAGRPDHGPRSQETAASRGKREVRLLDLNVQYYPCKICGCKFPSYYFVHKHRKLCHANEEERQGAEVAEVEEIAEVAGSTQDGP